MPNSKYSTKIVKYINLWVVNNHIVRRECLSLATLPCLFLGFCPGFLVLYFALSIIIISLLSKSLIMLGLGKYNNLVNIIMIILTCIECQLYVIFCCLLISDSSLTRNYCYLFIDYISSTQRGMQFTQDHTANMLQEPGF